MFVLHLISKKQSTSCFVWKRWTHVSNNIWLIRRTPVSGLMNNKDNVAGRDKPRCPTRSAVSSASPVSNLTIATVHQDEWIGKTDFFWSIPRYTQRGTLNCSRVSLNYLAGDQQVSTT